MALDVPLTHVFVTVAAGDERRELKRLDEITLDEARRLIVELVERVEKAEDEAAAMRLKASHTVRSSKRAKYATNRTRT
jgi:hypothetical protein